MHVIAGCQCKLRYGNKPPVHDAVRKFPGHPIAMDTDGLREARMFQGQCAWNVLLHVNHILAAEGLGALYGPLLPTWINFNSSTDKMWNEITYAFPTPTVILGMDMQFHPTLYYGCNYLSMLWLKLIHVIKRGQRATYRRPYTGRHCCETNNNKDTND